MDAPPKTPVSNDAQPARSHAAHGYAPWNPPFLYNLDGQWIEDIRGNRILDMRGWGYLTGKGSQALGLDEDEAAKIQDAIGAHVAELMNQDCAKGHNAAMSDCAGGKLES